MLNFSTWPYPVSLRYSDNSANIFVFFAEKQLIQMTTRKTETREIQSYRVILKNKQIFPTSYIRIQKYTDWCVKMIKRTTSDTEAF